MRSWWNIRALTLFSGFLLVILSNNSCTDSSLEGWIIATRVSGDIIHNNPAEAGFRVYENARLVALDKDNPGMEPRELCPEFHSACSPTLSWNAEYLFFSGKKTGSDPWQVWVLELQSGKIEQLTRGDSDCFFPAGLPDGSIAYTGTVKGMNGKLYHPVFKCNAEGSDIQQLSFHPHFDRCVTVMQDGRLLLLSRQEYPDRGRAVYMAVRPDGTKAELFHQTEPGTELLGRAYETPDGRVIFPVFSKGTESMPGLREVRVDRPLQPGNNLFHESNPAQQTGYMSAYPAPDGSLLVSARINITDNFGLAFGNNEALERPELSFQSPDYHIIEPVFIAAVPRPRKLPSAVKPEETAGSVLCQDIRVSELPASTDETMAAGGSGGIAEFWGPDSLLGSVDTESDGSFYVRIAADIPFRIRTVNSSGDVIRGPSAWMWVRPNERRGCAGCHADRELAPVNRVPLAVQKMPDTITVRMQ